MDELTFADELRFTPLNLPRAALRLAQSIAYPHLNVPAYLARLDKLAEEARKKRGQLTAQTLAVYLFQERGFGGNSQEYGDPRNSYLNELLDRRLGLPITLSILYLAVAGRLDISAYGVGLPGHFVVGVSRPGSPLLLDPFNGGQEISVADCQRLVRETAGYEGPFRNEWLAPTEPRLILVRILNNLRIAYLQQADFEPTLTVLNHLRQLQPNAPEHLRDLGIIHYELGNTHRAAQFLERFLQLAPDAPEAIAIRHNLQLPFSRWASLN